MSIMEPILKSSSIIKRCDENPLLTSEDIPYSANLVFNAGVEKWKGEYVMVFRNDYGYKDGRFEGTNLGLAKSKDGVKWTVEEKPFFTMAEVNDPEVSRIYDPRLTVIENELFICFAVDTKHGLRGGVGRVKDDLSGFETLSLSVPDNRNMVLFPEKINGMYVRLERPFPVYSRSGKDRFDTWISYSPDLVFWGESKLLLAVEDVNFANDKVGPAAPPIKTEKGWLTTFHAVDIDNGRGKNGWEESWKKRYTAGIMLLDLNDPSKIMGISKKPLIAPEAAYETLEGFRTNVIFPGGMILEEDNQVKIYYGASDAVECLVTADLNDLINECIN